MVCSKIKVRHKRYINLNAETVSAGGSCDVSLKYFRSTFNLFQVDRNRSDTCQNWRNYVRKEGAIFQSITSDVYALKGIAFSANLNCFTDFVWMFQHYVELKLQWKLSGAHT